MKNNSQTRNKSKYLTNIGFRFLLLCILLTSHLPKISAEDGFMLLQSTDVTLNLTNVSLETLFKTLEKKSNYVFFFKEDVLQKNEKVTVKAQNESVVSILNRILPPRQLTYTVKGRQVIIVRLPQKEEKKAEVPVEIKEYTVKGTVVDASGQPLPGVNITVQGTTNGVTTDLSGGFTLRIRDGKRALLVASYIGFSTRKVWVSGETNSLKIMLEESSASLNEVVVVGYGTQKKLNLTGAVTTASGEILENRPIANIAQGLQGMVPNLNITFNSGQPNEAAKINIRGNTSLNGGNALILVDGVEISDLSLINPQDVESVSVLKDASAAAVYGARAAFGVMLVTTKKGNRNQKTIIITFHGVHRPVYRKCPVRMYGRVCGIRHTSMILRVDITLTRSLWRNLMHILPTRNTILQSWSIPKAFRIQIIVLATRDGPMWATPIGYLSSIKSQLSCSNIM